MSDFEKLKNELKLKLNEAKNSQELDIIRTNIFGKNGLINLEFKKLGSLSPEDKKKIASEINKTENLLEKHLEKIGDRLNQVLEESKKNNESTDLVARRIAFERINS